MDDHKSDEKVDKKIENSPFYFEDSISFKKVTLLKRNFADVWMPFGNGSMQIEGDGFRIDYGANNLEVKWDNLSEIDDNKIDKGWFIANFGNITQPQIYAIQINKTELKQKNDKLINLFSSLPIELRQKRCPSCGNHVNSSGTCDQCGINADTSFIKGGLIKLLVGICVFVVAVIIVAKFIQDQSSLWAFFWKGVGIFGGFMTAIQGFRELLGKR